MITKDAKSDHLIENKIIRNLILSTEFSRKAFQIYKTEYIQNQYSKVIIKWIKEYFDKYDESPKRHMIDIFEFHKKDIKDDEYEYIESLLMFLSDEDEYDEDEKINHEYLYKQTEEYFQKRSYQVLAENLQNASKFGTIDDLQRIQNDFRAVERELSGWVDPFDPAERRRAYDSLDEDNLFRMPGKIGELMGDLKRSQLIIILAPAKTGKTMMLQEIAMQGLLNRLNVLYISLEMNVKRSELRLYKRISGHSDNGEFKMPVLDCVLNQTGQCKNPNKKNTVVIMDGNGRITPNKNYKICDYCRERHPKNFIQTVWYFNQKTEKFNFKNSDPKVEKFKKWYHPNLRFLNCRGKKMSQIVNSINILEQSEGFIPDIIIPDSIYLADDENNNSKGFDSLNKKIWIGKTLSEERNCLVASGHQGTRDSFNAKNLKAAHTSGSIQVLADCDGTYGLIHTDAEKSRGILRFSTLVDRDEHFVSSRFVSLLCNFSIGQIHLDSEWGEIA
jgi:hypothetical protein